MIDKRVRTTADAVDGVRDGSTVLVAGFGAEMIAGMTLERLQALTEPKLHLVADWRVLAPPQVPQARAA